MRMTKYALVLVSLLLPVVALATHVPGTSETVTYDRNLAPGVAATGTIGWAAPIDGYDWYCFDTSAGQQVTLTVQRTSGDIFPNVGAMLGISDDGTFDALTLLDHSENSTQTSATLEFTTEGGPVTVWVSTFLNENQGNYTLTMTGGTARASCTTPAEVPAGPVQRIVVNVPLEEQIVANDQTIVVPVSVETSGGFNSPLSLEVSGLPRDVVTIFQPNFFPAPGSGSATLTIRTTALTFPLSYPVTVFAISPDEEKGSRTFILTVFCNPPVILGVDQLRSTSFASGSSATLEIKHLGSGPFTYEWYSGPRGSVNFPVPGATTSRLTTSSEGLYWVRVRNACGSVDSAAAFISRQ